jgi:hypothetical protein
MFRSHIEELDMRTLIAAILLIALTACGAAATPGGTGTAPDASPSPDTVVIPSPSPDLIPTLPADAVDGAMVVGADVLQQTTEFLSTQTGVDASQLQVTEAEAVEWPDGSLGCAEPGMMYTQAIVPGYRMTFTDGSRTYELHTNSDGTNAVLCENGRPVNIGQP